MTRALPAPPVLVITDRLSAAGDLIDIVAQALHGGCRWLMVREKDLRTEELATLAGDIVAMARPMGARVMVNGDIDAARTARADGVHLQAMEDITPARRALGEGALIGVSCHSGTEIEAALGAGADYVIISPVFLTDSKPGYGPALGLDGLAVRCANAAGPVIGLAGISAENAADCLSAGAAGIAIMGGIMRSDDPAGTMRHILAAIEA